MRSTSSSPLAPRISRRRLLVSLLSAVFVLSFGAGLCRAEVHGGIEIGAKGVKITVVRATSGGDGLQMKVELATTANTTLVADLARTGAFAPEALEQTVAAVGKAYGRIRDEFKVAPERIYIVGSSGLFSAIREKPDLIDANKKRLADAVRQATDKAMDFLSDEREAELSIDGIIPRSAAATGLVLDIGSGNTKGGFKESKTGKYVSFSVPLGTVTFTDLVKKKAAEGRGTFGKVAAEQREGMLRPTLAWQMVGKPALLERPRVYLSGGSVWAITTLAHPGDRRPFVALTRADVGRYRTSPRSRTRGIGPKRKPT